MGRGVLYPVTAACDAYMLSHLDGVTLHERGRQGLLEAERTDFPRHRSPPDIDVCVCVNVTSAAAEAPASWWMITSCCKILNQTCKIPSLYMLWSITVGWRRSTVCPGRFGCRFGLHF